MNIVVVGGEGRLGKNVCDVLKKNNFVPIIVDIYSLVKNIEDLNKNLQISAIIDISSHENSIETLKFAIKRNIPLIIGCTGHTNIELAQIKQASSILPILLSYNFSIALQYFYKALDILANLDSNNYITEVHHTNKKDKPSGTAKEMAKIISNKSSVNDIFSIRKGNIIGLHLAEFICENESISITHEVFDRKVFAQGALFALNFIIKQQTGLYSMSDAIKTQNK